MKRRLVIFFVLACAAPSALAEVGYGAGGINSSRGAKPTIVGVGGRGILTGRGPGSTIVGYGAGGALAARGTRNTPVGYGNGGITASRATGGLIGSRQSLGYLSVRGNTIVGIGGRVTASRANAPVGIGGGGIGVRAASRAPR